MNPAQPEASPPARLASVDLLRGAVMVLMALDHARDFFGKSGWDPSVATAGAAIFLTRWITHFCAPVFVLLAGTGAALSQARGKSTAELSRFLLTRGAWLALLDLTLVSFVWFFRAGHPLVSDVMWVIGCSMIVLSVLVRLPVWLSVVLGLAMVAGHNALDGIHAETLGSAGWVWTLLHEQGVIHLPWAGDWFVGYPLIPWVGVMALGYACGLLFADQPARRRRRLIALGATALGLFLILRAINVYGDPRPWSPRATAIETALAFVDCEKYPPSLDYLLMTLGPALLALAALERFQSSSRHPLLVFGRVPLFYYVVHLYLIHLAAGLVFWPRTGAAAFHADPDALPGGYGVGLGGVYLAWMGAVLAMVPLCRWFAALKQKRRQSVWLSYL